MRRCRWCRAADVGYAALPGVKFAVITGTNGKTTTTALTGHLLETAGFKAVAAGNIDTLAQVALEGKRPEWVALEISSFQLHDTYDLVPTIGATTNPPPITSPPVQLAGGVLRRQGPALPEHEHSQLLGPHPATTRRWSAGPRGRRGTSSASDRHEGRRLA
ncbi:MAG: Mur ligase family protein [Gemmatimonadales bacterium]